MRERVLAVIGAICLISAALLVRSWLADRGEDDGGGGRRSSGELPVVACTPDLAAVCDALVDDGRIADDPPVLDLDGAAEPDEEIDAWITWDPAPQIANFDADAASQPEPWDGSTALASGTLGALGTEEAFAEACAGQTTWTCLGRGGIDGTVRLGVGEPQTAEGIVRLGPLAQATAEDPSDPAATLDRNLAAIVDGPPNGQATAAAMATGLATRPGGVDIVIGPRTVLDRIAATPEGRRRGLEARTVLNDQPVAVVAAWRNADGEALAQLCDGDGIDDGSATADALSSVGAPESCPTDATMTDQLAGFLYQVRREVG